MRLPVTAVALLLAATLALPSCNSSNSTRSGKLLTMAAEEAGFIDSLNDRLTRQLNIADLQIQFDQKAEALKTLSLAAATLHEAESRSLAAATRPAAAQPEAFDEFHRIAGWTSVAQLTHSAGDDKVASEAYLSALESLNSVKPEASRAQYVLSLSEVAFQLKGQIEAGRLLVKGGQWARSIPDVSVRRFALASFTSQLVAFDNLEDARTVMRNEPDAAWRADTLASIARNSLAIERAPHAPGAFAKTAASEVKLSAFNKDVRYENNFRQAPVQQGMISTQSDPSR